MVNTSGSIDFCCSQTQFRGDDGKSDINKTTLKQVWNGKDMRDIRMAMIQGEEVSSCKHCYPQEEVGKKSRDKCTTKNGKDELVKMQYINV